MIEEMLETLFTRWRNIQARIAGIVAELDAVSGQIEAAATIEEIEAALAGVNWP